MRVRSLVVPRDQAKAACQRSSDGAPGFAARVPKQSAGGCLLLN
jgi:hypothetical protein